MHYEKKHKLNVKNAQAKAIMKIGAPVMGTKKTEDVIIEDGVMTDVEIPIN